MKHYKKEDGRFFLNVLCVNRKQKSTVICFYIAILPQAYGTVSCAY
ncbi:hypothetical protein MTR67_052853 [Solanum verrucosum]|uniref:Uncharacterized protein n=1 Tax=Solanum verrucosum TaxID=315347 RepID=A0AAF0V5U7_SOLVR|nr:hypothetical protein MTR67_052853 [Solanum verrucosum]